MTDARGLLERTRSRVTFVTGAAGCGKTRAVTEYVAAEAGPHTHFLARPVHTDVRRFVRGLIDATSDDVPALRVGFASAAAAARRSARPAFLLAGWFAERLGADARTIALDDLHHVDDRADVRAFVVRAIERTSPNVRWILAGRDVATWPVATWLAASLASLPIEGRADGAARAFDGDVETAVRDWCDAREPGEIVTATALALLPDLSPRAVVALPGGRAVLAALDAALPCLRSGSRVRHEVAVALAGGEPSAARVPEAYALVRDVLARTSSERTRLEFFEAMRAEDDLVTALDRAGFLLEDEHLGDVLDAAIESLPPERRRTCAIALAYEARRETERGRHDLADSWYLQASARADAPSDKARIELRLAGDLLRRSSHGAADVFERLAAVDESPAFRSVALAGLGAGLAARGSWERGRACVDEALALLADIDNVAVRARVHRQAAYVFLRGGCALEARDHAARAIVLAETYGLDDILASALSVSMEVAASHLDDADAVLDVLLRLERCAERLDDAFLLRYARLGMLEAYGERGAWRDVARLEAFLASQELENDAIHTDETLLRIRALRAACSGDFGGAGRVLAAAGERNGEPAQQAFRRSEIAMYAAAAGDRDGALRAIDEASAYLAARSAPADALTVRCELHLVVAIALARGTSLARERLAAIALYAGRYPRLRALREVVTALLAFRGDAAAGAAVLDALARLGACGFGGVAAMLGELPLACVLERAS